VDRTQEQHERAVADAFIDWYNSRHGTAYQYHERGADPPDFVYRTGTRDMLLEVTAAYYDQDNAKMFWQNARGVRDAPQIWCSGEPDSSLLERVNRALQTKCAKNYPPGCVLVVALYPDITTAEEFAALIPDIAVPSLCAFSEIYVGGLFPASSGGSPGGYYHWRLGAAAKSPETS
jgi:hypothetical protein